MSKLTILASGSQGNCALYEAGQTRILIDAGISARQITAKLASIGVLPNQLNGILITHEHNDHACGVDVFVRNFPTPIYANGGTIGALLKKFSKLESRNFVQFGRDYFELDGVTVDPVPIVHDAVAPVGFVLYDPKQGYGGFTGFVTDTGAMSPAMIERFNPCDVMAIESNYDEALMEEDKSRPHSVHSRVASRNGHLSNEHCARSLRLLPHLREVILVHLSRSCNTPELAFASALEALVGRDVILNVAKP